MRRIAPRLSTAVPALGLVLGTLSCNIADPFEGYRDSTKNLIAASGLGASDLTPAGYQSSGVWTWAWGGATDADNFDYMTLTPAGLVGDGGAAVPAGLDPGATAYRLELVNLMPNGDFEGAVGGEWARTPLSDPATNYALVSDTNRINNQSLYLQIEGNTGHNIRFNLSALEDAAGSSAYHVYDWLAFVTNDSQVYYKVLSFSGTIATNNATKADLLTTTANDAIKISLTDNILFSDERAIVFGSGAPTSFAIDDVRVARSDIDNRIRLLMRPADASPALVRGYYEFSIWARKPAASRFVTEAGTAEPYAARALTLRMLQLSPSQSSAEHSYPLDGTADSAEWGGTTYDASSGWVRLVLRLAQGGNFVFDPYSAEPVLELSLAPYDYAQAEPGAVEIAQPELRFYLNGY